MFFQLMRHEKKSYLEWLEKTFSISWKNI